MDDVYTIHNPGYIGWFTSNDNDPDEDFLTTSIISPPSHGTLGFDFNEVSAHPWFTPHEGYVGTDSLTYRICDPSNACATANVTINIVNQNPVAVSDIYEIHNPGYIGWFRGNDRDADGDSLTVRSVSPPAHGRLVYDYNEMSDHPWYYPPNYAVTDSLSYTVCDRFGGCSTATVTINVVNRTPVAADDTYSLHRDGYIGWFRGNDRDADGDSLTVKSVSQPTHGRLVFDYNEVSDHPWYYPKPGYSGTDTLTYQVCDNFNACATATVTINIVNEKPTAADDRYTVTAPGYIGWFKSNDRDPDGDWLATTIVSPPSHGTLIFDYNVVSDRPWYSPTPGYTGADSLTYRVCDDFNACATATVLINNDDANAGATACNANVGEPVNVTNGNMYLQQTDYLLPGAGEPIVIQRTYNSNSPHTNFFGRGWATAYDETIRFRTDNSLRLYLSDGRAVDFSRSSSAGVFVPTQADFHGQITKNAKGSFALLFPDGRIHRFDAAGKLLTLADRNNNQTTLTYDADGSLTSVIDTSGRVLNVTSDANGQVTSIADGFGLIATYAYGSNRELSSVIYADNSKYQFTYALSSGSALTSVTDALGNVVESHTYVARLLQKNMAGSNATRSTISATRKRM